ncbi:flagellar basal body P-ring formation chaperone FlgA [Helicobacter mesocricetorum]|uniref:flagellar basal body P-ring formation chaperone FlgA n=1 Tax=Helicobacter mesocricetorum TaxID=87012 RepID=UPI000CF16F25|nr:flagellar basal body P-ring formation chaperone FlgA [Helicobacter mesocricetorum]
MNIFTKVLLSLLVSIEVCFGVGYFILEEEYLFKDTKVYAKNIFKGVSEDFLLLEIPKNANSFQVKSSQLIEKFESVGIHIGAKSPIITFKKEVGGNTDGIKAHIAGLFFQEYQKNNIKIHSIKLEQITLTNFEEENIKAIDFSTKLLKRKEGTFNILLREGERDKKVFFKYSLDATLEGIVLVKPLSGGESINYQNAKIVEISFDKINSALMQKNQLGQVAVRSYTPRDVLITEDRLVKPRVVKKGDKILVGIKEGGVVLEFILESQKNGGIGDVIKAKDLESKKIYEVKIQSKGRGELL